MAKKETMDFKKKKKNNQQDVKAFFLSEKKDTSINYRLLSFTEVPFYAFISYQ